VIVVFQGVGMVEGNCSIRYNLLETARFTAWGGAHVEKDRRDPRVLFRQRRFTAPRRTICRGFFAVLARCGPPQQFKSARTLEDVRSDNARCGCSAQGAVMNINGLRSVIFDNVPPIFSVEEAFRSNWM